MRASGGRKHRRALRPLRFELLEPRRVMAVLINEFLTNNTASIVDQDGANSDWVELYNNGASAVSLNGWYLTDNAADLDQWQLPNVSIAAGGYLVVFASGKNRQVAGQELHTNFTLEDTGEYLGLVMSDGVTVASAFAPNYPGQLPNLSYGLLPGGVVQETLIDEISPVRVHVPTSSTLGTTWTAISFNDSTWLAGTTGVGFERTPGSSHEYTSYIDTDVNSLMTTNPARNTAYIRMPFSVADVGTLTSLQLRMRYDDGFVVYLNGQEMTGARRNFTGTPVYNSSASNTHSDSLAVLYETIDVTQHLGKLVNGNNVLAIHGLNQANNTTDFLISPMLLANRVGGGTPNYFSTPTPGAANQASGLAQVADTTFSVDRGFYDTPFQVSISSATPSAQIRYTLDGSTPTATTGLIYAGPITINKTTTLRAAAFKSGFAPSDVDTQTYVFLSNVIQQSGAGLPAHALWGHDVTGDGVFDPDWAMDPDIVNNQQWSGTIKDDLKSVPTVSLVMPWNDWFGSGGQGIYISGTSSERAVSVEMFSADGSEEFQINGAVEIQGGSSNDRWKDDKLSLQVKFKEAYGPSKLDYPLFTDPLLDQGATHNFDTFVLDGVLNFAWVHTGDANQRANAKYIQDQVVADVQNLMGGKAPHGRYVHLYLNGLYWGMYYLHEKPDEHFAEEYLGGDESEYDVLKHNPTTVVGGSPTAVSNYASMLTAVRQNMTVAANYNAVLQKLEIDAFIDYMVLNYYVGNTDWDHHNWYATFNRVNPQSKWLFHSWDAEHVFKSLTEDVTTKNNSGSPTEIHTRLLVNADYRLRFADHVQKHFFNGGLLMPAQMGALYDLRADQIDRAIVGESARWGDNSSPVPYTRDNWRATQDNLLANYFPARSDIVLNQFRADNLFPAVDAPQFSRFGGTVNSGFVVTLSKTASTPANAEIYYTTDGSDPRFSDLKSTSPINVTINAATQLKARVLSDGVWSPATEATFLLTNPFPVRIVEMNYHPADRLGVADPEDMEFVELLNVGTQTVNLQNVKVDTGIMYQFTSSVMLTPNQRIVIARDRTVFQSVYGTGVNLAPGAYTSRLDNAGEQVRLFGPLGELLQDITYSDDDPWPGRADGKGSTLEFVNPTGAASDAKNWRSSYEYGGTPGAAGVGTVNRVVVNEVLTHTDPPQIDSIELYNSTAAAINIGGWFLSDSSDNYKKFRIPAGTTIGPGQYLVFDEDDFNAVPPVGGNLSFGLSSEGDDAWLLSADAGGNLLAFEQHAEFIAAINGESFGRWTNGTGELYPMKTLTLGAANSGPRIGPLAIGEVMYNPVGSNPDLEFIEVVNLTTQTVALSEAIPGVGTVGWRIDGLGFDFPASSIIGPRGTLVVVRFDTANAALANAFRTTYGIGPEVQLIGGYTGLLDNAGERIRLLRPDAPNPATPTVVPYVLIDEVDYGNTAPWPISPNQQFGESLTRSLSSVYGDEPTNWIGATASPGTSQLAALNVTPSDFNFDGHADAADIPVMLTALVNLPAFKATHSLTDVDVHFLADANGDHLVTNADLQALLTNLIAGGGSIAAGGGSSSSSTNAGIPGETVVAGDSAQIVVSAAATEPPSEPAEQAVSTPARSSQSLRTLSAGSRIGLQASEPLAVTKPRRPAANRESHFVPSSAARQGINDDTFLVNSLARGRPLRQSLRAANVNALDNLFESWGQVETLVK